MPLIRLVAGIGVVVAAVVLGRLEMPAAPDAWEWTRRSAAAVKAGDIDTAAHALAASLRAAPWERALQVDRSVLAARVWPALSPQAREQALAAMLQAWDLHRPHLIARLPPDAAWPLYRRLLAERPEALAALHD